MANNEVTQKRQSAGQQDAIRKDGDQEMHSGKIAPDKAPGKGRPDKEEGVGTVQNQRR